MNTSQTSPAASDLRYILVVGLLVAMGSLAASPSYAQGTIRVNVSGVPPVLSTPLIGELEQNVRQGRYTTQVTYQNPSGEPVEVRFRVRFRYEGESIAEIQSQPVTYQPGTYVYRTFDETPEVQFRTSGQELVKQLRERLRRHAVRSGVLPEGEYVVEIEPELVRPERLITPIRGMAQTTVRYPQPPTLISPANGATLTAGVPVFSWTPVQGTPGDIFDYELLIVEVRPGQTPLQAIESNRPVTGRRPVTVQQTSFSYTRRLPPLEEGQTYAWQVRARETTQEVPLRDEGETPIHTFTYGQDPGQQPIAEVSSIPLVPDFASLTQLDDLEVHTDGSSYVLNGPATLRLSFAAAPEPVTAPVQVEELRVSTSDPSVLRGGFVTGEAPEDVPGDSLGLIRPRSVQWGMDEGVTLRAQIQTPSDEALGETGTIRLTPGGPLGTLRATGAPITRLSADPLAVDVTELRAEFPQQTLQATGELHAFGTQTECTLDPLRLGARSESTVVDCTLRADIPLASDTSTAMQVRLRHLQGTLDAHWGEEALDYEGTATAGVRIDIANAEPCGARATLGLTAGEGATLRESTSDCRVPTPRIDLGMADLLVDEMHLDVLQYRPGTGWDARLSAEAAAELLPFGRATLPTMDAVEITPEGVAIPSVSLASDDLGHLESFTTEGIEMDLQAFSAAATTVPWESTNRTPTRSAWPFAVDLALAFPNFSPEVPACVRDAQVEISDAQVQNGTFSPSIPATQLENCRLSLSPDPAALTLDQLSGSVEVTSGDQTPRLDPTLRVAGTLHPESPVQCGEGDRAMPLAEGGLRLEEARGVLEGRVERLETNCRLVLGPLSAEMSNLALRLEPVGDRQGVVLEGTARLDIDEETTASGPFRLNLRRGRLTELDIRIEDPFELGIPRENPVLVFRLQEARLTPEGLFVDGRHELVLPQTTIGATFDDVQMGLSSRKIEEGRILIDRAFGFSAGVDTSTQALSLRAVGSDSTVTASPGLYFGLSGTPQIDSTGLTLQGTTTPTKATLDVPALQQSSGLEAVLTDSFSVGLRPFGIADGRVTFRRSGAGSNTAIGYADRDGLHLTPLMATASLPAQLPLPSNQIAYLRLKDDQGNLLVQTQWQANGQVQLSTKPNQPLELVLPALQGSQAQPPRLTVSLNQFTIDAANGTYVSGTLTATVPQGHALRDLTSHSIPLHLREARFGTEQIAGTQRQALFLDGGLSLFGTALKAGSPQHHATFYIESGSTAEAQIDLQNLNTDVPVAGGGQAAVDVSSVTGSASVPLGSSGAPSFNMQVDGAFALRTSGGSDVASADVQLTYERSVGAGSSRLTVSSVQANSLSDPDSISVGNYKLGVPSINTLSLSYDAAQNDLRFSTSLDTELTFVLPSGPTFTLPLRHVTLDDQGFTIPKQSVNASSVPGLNLPRLPMGPVEVKPLALRTSAEAQFDWFGGGSFSLRPKLDLAVYMPSFHGTNPGPSQGMTLSDVQFTNGTLSGTGSYTPQSPPQIPLGPPSAQPPEVKITRIDAGLQADSAGTGQDVDVSIDAELVSGSGPLHVASASQCPSPTTVTLSLVEGPGLTGQAQNTDPCGELQWGPVTLGLTQATLDFSFAQNTQHLVATGSVEATFPNAPQNQSDVSVTASNVSVDLIAGNITSGAVTVNTPIRVPVPLGASNPLLTFQVGTSGTTGPVATLDQNGLELGQVSGHLDLATGSASVTFNNLRFGLDPDQNFPITQGTATIASTVAAETSFSPLGWTLVDSTTAFTAQSGARLSMDSDVTLSSSGLTFTGGGEAEARLAGQDFTSLRLGFQNSFTIDTQPATVTQGRANLYLDEDGQQSTSPIIWFDQNGMHTSVAGAAQAAVPDTLGLPKQDVAYLVLRDQNGTLLVDSSQTSNGDLQIKTQSGSPVELVLTGLDDSGTPPSANVGFTTTIDDGGNVSVDSLGLSFQGNLDLGADYPFTLTHASYQRNDATPFGVQAEVELPATVTPDEAPSVALSVGSNGFEGQVRGGTYAERHSSSLEQQTPVAEVEHPDASNPTFTVKVRGLDFQFGSQASQHTYKISGDFQTPLLTSQGPGGSTPVLIHYSGSYSASSQSWNLTGTANHIQGDLPMGVGTFDPNATNGIVVSASSSEFSLELNGVFSVPDVLQDFAVTVNSLKIGLQRQNQQTQLLASVGSAQVSGGQQVQLFGGALDLSISQSELNLQENPFVVTATVGGDLTFLHPNKSVQFSNLTVGSDGRFSAGNVQVNDLDIIGQHLTLKTLAFSQPAGTQQVEVDATAEATLPDPVSSTATADITVKRTAGGRVTTDVQGPRFSLDDGQYKIDNNPTTEVDLDGFATLDLTGVGVDLNILQSSGTPALYATASMYLKNNTSKRIDFGDAGQIQQQPGIKMALQDQGGSYTPDVEYNVTAQASQQNPLFEFNTGAFFRVTLTKIRLSGGTSDPMQVALGGSAGIAVPGIVGSVGYEGFTVGKSGVVDEGQLTGGGSFGLLPRKPGDSDPKPVFKLDVGAFETSRSTASVSYREHTGQQSSSGKPSGSVNSTSVPVDRYLRFYNESGANADAIGISIDVGKEISGAGVKEVLFFETTQGEIVARVKEARLDLKGSVVTASIRYTELGGGFQFDVAGEATLGEELGDIGKSAIVVGTFGISSEDKLRVGLFAGVEGLGLPVIPGLIEIDGLGAGFFLRAQQKQKQQITDAVSLSEKKIITAKRSEIESNGNDLFMIKAYGAVGLLGTSGSYVMRGQAMVTISNAYSMVEVRVAPNLPGLDGGEALSLLPVSKFEQSAVLGVTYAGTPSVSGAAYAMLRPTPVVTLTLRVAFYAQPGENDWAVYSAGTKHSNVNKPGVQLDLLALINIGNGKFVLSPDGFYADLSKHVSLGGGVVRLRGGFELQAWAVQNQSMGAYAEAYLKIDAKLKTVGVEGKGAFIKKSNSYLLYGYGAVDVAVGKIEGHAALYNGNMNAGLGVNDKYENMIDDARDQAESMAEQAEQTANRMEDLKNAATVPDPSAVATSSQGLRKAGETLHSQGRTARSMWANTVPLAEQPELSAQSGPFSTVLDVVRERRPDSTAAHDARQAMEQELNQLQKIAPAAEKRLRQANARLAEITAEHRQRAASLSSPIQNTQLAPTTDSEGNVTQLPSFTVNASQAQMNNTQIEQIQQDPQALDQRYQEALTAALSDLQMFDRVANGSSVVDYQVVAQNVGLEQSISTQSINPTTYTPSLPGGGGPHPPTASAGRTPAPPPYSISDVGEQYKSAVTAVHEHYAKRLDYYRRRQDAYEGARNTLHSNLGSDGQTIESHLQSAPSFSFNSSMSESDCKTAVDIIGNRYYYVEELRTGSTQQASQRKSNETSKFECGTLTYGQADTLGQIWTHSGMELWWDIHDLGLLELTQSMTTQLRDVASAYETKTQDLEGAHGQYTQSVDRFYALKADLATLTYGMAKEYKRWRQHADLADTTGNGSSADTLSTDPSETLNNLAASLEPPKITNIAALGLHEGYYTKTTLLWNLIPRSNGGEIRELSYDIQRGGTPSIGQMDFKTMGGDPVTTLTHYGVQTNYESNDPLDPSSYATEQEKTYGLGLRGRGDGGNTTARTGTFQVPLTPNSSTSAPGGTVMDTDTTPPTTPTIRPKTTASQDVETGEVRVQFKPGYGYTRPVAYWATDSSTVRLVIWSQDNQSDVTKIEYAAGSQYQQTDRQAWTQIPGVRLQAGTNQSGANWHQWITIRDLDLSENTEVYLSLRTTNGAGLTSQVQTVSEPFKYDPTPPVVDTADITVRNKQYRQDPSNLSFHSAYTEKTTSAVDQTPGWTPASGRGVSLVSRGGGTDQVDVSVTVPASDDGSGFQDQDVRLLDRSVDPETAFNKSSTCRSPCVSQVANSRQHRIDWSNTGASFADTLYAYARTTNFAQRSTVTEVPVRPRDATRPTTPTVRVRPTEQGATLYLTERAEDQESGIAGYQYAVGTSPHADDVRSWSSSGTDFDHRNIPVPFLRQYNYPPMSISIPSNELPSSGSYYVTVRAVNRQGDVSESVTSGPAAYDSTPPLSPRLWTHYDPAGRQMDLMADNLGDPESGLRNNTAPWKVRDLIDDTIVREQSFWLSNLGTDTVSTGDVITIYNDNRAHRLASYGYRFVITVENGAGMTRTVSTNYVVPPIDGWGTTQQEQWRRSVRTLRSDGVSHQRIAQIPPMLARFSERDRAQLLQDLDRASTDNQRLQVLQTIEQGPSTQ